MPPKRHISIMIDVKGGTLFLNGSAVTTVYDTRSCAWFKSNDVASALGYANASSSVSQMISPGDKSAFKDICLHKDSSMVESDARNVFINQRGMMDFLSARDPSCDVLKIRSISQSLNRSADPRRPNICLSSDKIKPRVTGAQKPAVTAITSERVSGSRSDPSAIVIDIRGETLFLNRFAVATVYDTRSYAWFKSNDVADALGYSNASSSVSQRVSTKDKVAFNDIALHKDSPQVPAHPRNVFINQSGLISFLLDLYPSCATHKIQCIGLSLKNNQPNDISQLGHKISNASQLDSALTPREMQNREIPRSRFFINGKPITLIVDANKHAWFKVSDVALALGFANANTSVSQHVSDMDKNYLKDIVIHKDSPAVNADLRNIFINQKGLMDVLHRKRREGQATQVSTGFPRDNPANLSACDKVVLKAVYSCFKDLNRTSSNLIPDYRTSITYDSVTNLSSPTNSGLKTPTSSTNTLIQTPPRHSTIPSSRSLSYYTANAHAYDCSSNWCEGYIIIIEMESGSANSLKVVQSTDSPDSNSNKNILWRQQVHSAPKILNLIEHFLSDWISTRQYYNLPFKQLADVVSTICFNFEKTLKTVYELTSKIDSSSKTSKNLQPMSKDQINSLTGSPNSPGEWIYIASSIPYAQRNVFKVGSTGDRLVKRLSHYQTGRLNEDRFHFFEVFPVHHCKKIDNLILFFLRPWSQNGDGRPTEMYTLDFETLSSIVSEIISYYENSYKCVLSLKTGVNTRTY